MLANMVGSMTSTTGMAKDTQGTAQDIDFKHGYSGIFVYRWLRDVPVTKLDRWVRRKHCAHTPVIANKLSFSFSSCNIYGKFMLAQAGCSLL